MWFLAIMAIISAAVSAVGIKQSAVAQKNAADYNADINKKNAQASDAQAMADAQETRIKNKRLLSAQQAAFGASGIDPNSGSATDVKQDSAIEGEMNALISLYTGRTGANTFANRARLSEMQGSSAQTAGNIGVATSLLTGSGNTYSALNPKF